MKKLLLATAVAALSITAAQAAPTVYGKAFLTLDINEGDTDVTTTTVDAAGNRVSNKVSTSDKGRSQLNSIGSRIGFKGSENLSANTDLVYQLEYGVDVDADKGGNFRSRDTYLGLANKQFGTLVAGRLTAIDDNVNYANVTAGGVLGGDNVLATFNGPRANNALAYFSPNYNGVKFSGMYVMDENNDTDNLGRDAFGVAVQYEPADLPLQAGASYIQAGDLKFARVSGKYQITPAVGVGALYQNSDFGGDEKENAVTVSGSYDIANTPWNTYAQVDLVDNARGIKDAEAQRVVLGGKYAFNQQTTGHVYGAYLKEEVSGLSGANAHVKQEFDGIGVGAGLEYKF